MFYTDISSSVSLNPGFTPRFEVLRGIRQGCRTYFPKAFYIGNPIANSSFQSYHGEGDGITFFNKEFKISQFADDTSIFLKDK